MRIEVLVLLTDKMKDLLDDLEADGNSVRFVRVGIADKSDNVDVTVDVDRHVTVNPQKHSRD